MVWKKGSVVAAGTVAAFALLAGTAEARPGGTTVTRASSLGTAGVAATASDNSVCSQIVIFGVQNWQCTPVLVATANAFASVNIGGNVRVSGFATCEYRKRSDGLNNEWTNWTSCGPLSRSASSPQFGWSAGQSPASAQVRLEWARIQNSETAFATDCVEIRTSISATGTTASTLETTSATARYPSFGTNLSGICEGSSAY